MMSARVLFVFGHNLTLECREGSWDTLTGLAPNLQDDWSRFLPAANTIAASRRNDHFQDWCWGIHFFTRRRLTEPNDRWFAFAGITEAYSRASGRQIVAGVWRERIIEDLVSWVPPKPPPSRHSASSSSSSSSSSSRSTTSGSTTTSTPNTTKPTCSNSGSSECSQSPAEVNFPSWTWLGTEWSSQENGIMLHVTGIEELREPAAKLVSIKSDGVIIGTHQLEISGAVLPTDRLLSLLAHYRDSPGRNFCPGRGLGRALLVSRVVFFACSCVSWFFF